MVNIVRWRKIIVFHHVCYWIDANVEWLIELELFVAFRQKQTPQAKSLACLVRGLSIS